MFIYRLCYANSNFIVLTTYPTPVRTRSLSRLEAQLVLSWEREGRSVVTLDELRRAVSVSPGHARTLAHRLVRKGWLDRGRRGVYLLNPSRRGPEPLPDRDPFRVGRLLVEPYYFGYATAAELHGLLPQAGRTYYLATPGRSGHRPFGSSEFRLVHVARPQFFGTMTLLRRSQDLVVSDLERTVLDCIDRPEFAGGMGGAAHIFALAKPRLRWTKLERYLERVGRRSLTQRVGYLAQRVRPSRPPPRGFLRRLRPPRSAAYAPLGPPFDHGRTGPHEPEWRVIENVPDSELFAEGRIR